MRAPRPRMDAQGEIIYGVIAVMMGASLGVGLRAVANAAAGAGAPRGGAPSAVVALAVGGVLLVFGEALLARRHAYAALVLYPLALIVSFVLMGGF
jgi:hypothetical protein